MSLAEPLPSPRALEAGDEHLVALELHAERRRVRKLAATEPHVLVVDDDEIARPVLASLLRAEGFTVSTASDGEAALAEVRRAVPDLVLTDLHMPHMDGVELCQRLHEIDDDLPVIIMTAQADMMAVIESLRSRAEDFLTKPLDRDQVVWRVRRAIARRAAKLEENEFRRTFNERLILHGEAERLQRAQLGALLANLSEGVAIVAPGGRILMINDAARAMLALAAGESTVGALDALGAVDLAGRRQDAEQRPLVRALKGESFTDYEVVCARRDGDRRRFVSSGTNVRDQDGHVALAIIVFRDVTEQRRLDAQRAEYLALVSHDLRNPLGVVLMALSVLKESADADGGPSSGARRTKVAERAERNAKRMAAMLEEITESTSLESQVALRRTACDLRDVVANVIDSLDDTRATRLTVEADETTTYEVHADASRLERVVANFVTNALKYSADKEPVRVRLAHEGADIVVEVIDRGIGIAPDSVKRLFDQYYRAPGGEKVASGLGLGLYIARLIVEAHGGRIEVSSEVGEGSKFRLILPSSAAV